MDQTTTQMITARMQVGRKNRSPRRKKLTRRTPSPVRREAICVVAPVLPASRDRVMEPYPGIVPDMVEVRTLAAPRATSSRLGLMG
jgi:hypothetical protein